MELEAFWECARASEREKKVAEMAVVLLEVQMVGGVG